jgi:hypothetical protein
VLVIITPKEIIFSLSFHYFLLYFPNLFTIQLTFLPYFPNHFTIQLIFLPYFRKDLENTEENKENTEENCEMISKIWKKSKLKSKKIWKIQKKVVQWYGKYGKKSWLNIFQIISLFSSIFSLSFHNLFLYFPNLFTIRLAFLPYFPYHFTFQLNFLPNFPYHFTIQLNSEKIWKIWKKPKLNSEKI